MTMTTTTTTTTTIDLQPFCAAKNNGPYAIARPFVQDGHLCATDYRIAVRVPTDQPYADPPDGLVYPPTGKLIVPK